MSDYDSYLLEFIGILAYVRKELRCLEIFASKQSSVSSISVTVAPTKTESVSDYADAGVTMLLALDAELKIPLDDNKKAIGASFLLRRSLGIWIVEAEVGWSGSEIGWDAFHSQEIREELFAQVAPKIPELLEQLSARFRSAIIQLSSDTRHG